MFLPNISPELLKKYQESIEASVSPATAKRKVSSLRRFFSWAESKGILSQNPIETGGTGGGSHIDRPQPGPVRTSDGTSTGQDPSRFLAKPIGTEKQSPTFTPNNPTQTYHTSNLPIKQIIATTASIGLLGLLIGTYLSFQPGQFLYNLFSKAETTTPTQPATNYEPSNPANNTSPSPSISDTSNTSDIPTSDVPDLSSVTISTSPTSDGDITLSPDGNGSVNIRSSTTTNNTLDIKNANLTTGNLIEGYVGNNGTNYNLLYLSSGATPVERFSVDALGNVFARGDIVAGHTLSATNASLTGDLKINGVTRLNSLGRLASITGYYQDSGLFKIDQGSPDTVIINKAPTTSQGSATADSITFTLDETNVTASNYDTLVLKRVNAGTGGYALDVRSGNTNLAGDVTIGGTLTTSGSGGLTTTNLTVSGDADFRGNVYDSTGNLTLNDNVDISGTTSITGAATLSSTLAVSGATTLSSTVTVAGTTTLNGIVNIGDGGDTAAIDTSDWDISTTGVMTGISGITTDGGYTQSGSSANTFTGVTTFSANVNLDAGFDVDDAFVVADGGVLTTSQLATFNGTLDANGILTLGDGGDAGTISTTTLDIVTTGNINLADDVTTKTIDIGGVTNSGTDTINIATNSTAADIITIGNSNTGTTLALTGGDDWSITAAGAATFASATFNGDLDMTNDLILNIGAAGTDFTTGGGLTLAEALVVNDDATFTLAAGEKVLIDATTTDSTGTAGALDIDLDSTTSQAGIDLDIETITDAGADTLSGLKITATQTSTDDDAIYGLHVANLAGTADAGAEYGIYQAGTSWDYGIYVEDAAHLNTTLAVVGVTTLTGTLTTNGDVDLGNAASDTITFTGVVDSNILADANNTRNLGSSSVRWANVYGVTGDFTNISGTVTGGSTTSAAWTINSDNATANAEISSLAFETGTNPINAVIQWNASGDAGRYTGYDDNLVANYPISVMSQVSGANQTFTSGSLFNYGQNTTHTITQSGAFVGLDIDFSSNITNTTQNQTGALVTLRDGSSSGTAIGYQTAGTLDIGLDIGGTIGTAEIRLSNGETIANTTDGTLALTASTTTLSGDLGVNGSTSADITSSTTTASLFNTTVTTLNLGGAATTVSLGASTGTTTVNHALAVTGQCVAKGTRIRRRRRRRKNTSGVGPDSPEVDEYEDIPVEDIKPGDEVLSLNDKTGDFEWHKVEETMDKGIKKTYLLITENGKTIRTTAEHPYFIWKQPNDPNWLQKDAFEHTEKLARDFYYDSFAGRSIYSPALKEKIHFTQEGWNHFVEKSRSINELITRFFVLPRVPSVLRTSQNATGYRKIEKETITIEYWELQAIVEYVHVRIIVSAVNGGAKFFLSCNWLGTKLERGIKATKKELSLSPRKSSSHSDRRRRLVTSQLFNKVIIPEKGTGVNWTKVSQINIGDKIATIDGWEKVIKIEGFAREKVFDLQIEGTRNFVANDIVAHNTTLNGIANIGDGGDAITLSGTTYSLTTTSTNTVTLADNIANAFDLQEGTNNYININTTNSSENISFGNATTNPTYSYLGTGAVTIAGSADGTDALKLTLGDILVTDGDLDLSGGDFNVTLDAGDGVNIAKGSAPTVDVFTINGGTSATDGVDALQLTFTGSNASGNVVDITPSYTTNVDDTFNIFDIDAFTATSDGTGTTTATVRGINVGNLTESVGTSDVVTSTGLNFGTGWDTDINATTSLEIGIGGTNEIVLNATDFSPATSDGNALGTSSLMWSDLFLASGAVVNFNNGDVTLTHASNLLTFGGGNLDMSANIISNIGNAGTDFGTDGSLTTAAGITVTTGGLTVTAGGATITAGNLTLSAGQLALSGQSSGIALIAAGGSITSSSTTHRGLEFGNLTTGTSATTGIDGIYVGITTTAGSYTTTTATLANLNGFNKGASHTITTARGLYVGAINVGGTNNYGIYVEAPSGGATTNTGIYVAGGGMEVAGGLIFSNSSSLQWRDSASTARTILQISSDDLYIDSPAGASNDIFFRTAGDTKMTILGGGNVGIGTAAPEARMQVTGGGLCVGSDANCNTDNNTEGVVYSSSTAMSVYDVAENYPTKDETLVPGEVVTLDPDRGVFVVRSSKPYDSKAIGAISEKPAVLLGGFNGAQFKEERQVAVALTGRILIKVTGENGSIKKGDFVTSSSTPGVAMKATRSGPVIGQALENFSCQSTSEVTGTGSSDGEICQGKILVFVNVSYADPTSALADLTTNLKTGIIKATDLWLEGVAYIADAVITGSLEVKETLTAKTVKTDKLLSPLVIAEQIETTSLTAQTARLDELTARQAQITEASISGTLTANVVKADDIQSSVIDKLKDRLDTLATNVQNAQANLQAYDQIEKLLENSATESENLTLEAESWETNGTSLNLTENLNVLGNINAYGTTTLADTFILGSFTLTSPNSLTSLTLGSDSLVVTDGTLNLLASQGVSIMEGTLFVDGAGKVQIRGNLEVEGTIKAQALEVETIEASGSATIQKLIIAAPSSSHLEGEVAPAAHLPGEIVSNATAGKGVLPAGTTEITINNPNVTDTTLVYVTPQSSTQNQTLYVLNKNSCTSGINSAPCSPYFTVAIDQPSTQDIKFNWWIIDLKAPGQ